MFYIWLCCQLEPNLQSNSQQNQEVFQKQFSSDSESVHGGTFCSDIPESDSDFFLIQTLNQTLNYSYSDSDSYSESHPALDSELF